MNNERDVERERENRTKLDHKTLASLTKMERGERGIRIHLPLLVLQTTETNGTFIFASDIQQQKRREEEEENNNNDKNESRNGTNK